MVPSGPPHFRSLALHRDVKVLVHADASATMKVLATLVHTRSELFASRVAMRGNRGADACGRWNRADMGVG
eukprot:6190282-Prorocentrum_lima.AAC.1